MNKVWNEYECIESADIGKRRSIEINISWVFFFLSHAFYHLGPSLLISLMVPLMIMNFQGNARQALAAMSSIANNQDAYCVTKALPSVTSHLKTQGNTALFSKFE